MIQKVLANYTKVDYAVLSISGSMLMLYEGLRFKGVYGGDS
jgi:hypothetical protein